MTTWNSEQLQEQFKQVERRAQTEQDDCKRQVRAGKRDYEFLYDQASARECIANRCKTCDESALHSLRVMRD